MFINYMYMKTWIDFLGELLTEMSDAAGQGESSIFDLHVTGNTLMVPRFEEKSILFYSIC